MVTNFLDKLDEEFRNSIDEEVFLGPSLSSRTSVFLSVCSELGATCDDVDKCCENLVGYVAGDIRNLLEVTVKESGRTFGKKEIQRAQKKVQPSCFRLDNLLHKPSTTWSSIGGSAGGAKSETRRAVEWPLLKKDLFSKLKITPPRGILFYGPPGTGKTLLAKASSNSSGVCFISLSPSDVYKQPYVGSAEEVIRMTFRMARNAKPCILFVDEIDGIVGNNGGKSGMERSGVEARVMTTFLNEMDGADVDKDDGVLVLAATNRPWTLDKALLRAGRFEKRIYVGPPDEEGRKEIYKVHTKEMVANELHLDYDILAEESENFTGAEIEGVCRRGKGELLQREIDTGESNVDSTEAMKIFVELIVKVKPLLMKPGVMDDLNDFRAQI
ncbi:hypothetical protein TrST_g6806 [Triparma strigata]|uniref:AAA+ ATPase domain-containing protein n=1 Tax=Triparma strigata TaxID=1606541 RepID=A0A9W7EAP0_9STRA|nr:hypothetical protein TrST_g6806 [Triparma strigata]